MSVELEELTTGTELGAESLLGELLDAGLLLPTGVDGLYGRSGTYQEVAEGIHRLVRSWGAELDATRVEFPPVLARQTFAETNYLESFPDLMGSVHVFRGGDREHRDLLGRVATGGDWQSLLEPAEVVLGSAACHAVYPLCRGQLPAEGRFFDVSSYCFRHEPSLEPTRLQAFVMHEIVFVGDGDRAQEHRDRGLERGLGLLRDLGLEVMPVPANDPFFGRVGAVLASGQLEEELKIEGVTDVRGNPSPTAIMSGNCHREHFGHPFAIETASGDVAHSACVAFGVDRIVVALLAHHGLNPAHWPAVVRQQLAS